MGYLVDLATVTLDDLNSGNSASWIQAMPLGTYDHPVYGEIDFTPEKIAQFAENVNSNVRGTELDIDYDHKEHGGQAAGWVKRAEARPTGLWILVEWTKQAADFIKSKAYKYFSPEFDDEWTNPKTKVTYQNVLFGGGITNRPFLKDILPLNLSEAFAEAGNSTNEGGGIVDPEQLKEVAKLLGLPDDATGDQILGALQVKFGTPSDDGTADPADPNESGTAAPSAPASGTGTAAAAELSEHAALTKLSESNPAIKQLMDVVSAQGKELKEARVDKALVTLSEKAKTKGWGIPPTTKDALREVLIASTNQQLSDSVVQAFDKLLDTGLVQLGEVGSERHDSSGADVAKQFSDAVQKIQTDHKVDYADACIMVAKEQPQLFADYQNASYAFRETN
jgi:phage I-like protein